MSGETIVIRESAPAKINLSLRILGKREDGFHEIDTLMVPLSLADEVELSIHAGAGEVSCAVEGMPELDGGENNLAVRAAKAFFSHAQCAKRCEIELRKRVPMGAGLGGGSSDAAAVLRGLNKACGEVCPMSELIEIASSLGSDVPFFLGLAPARCTGRGEVIGEAGIDVPPMKILLVKPPFGVSTPDAYKRWAGSEEIAGIDYAPQSVEGLKLVNELERPVFQKFLLLADLKSWLREQSGVEGALLSGSGATIFAVLNDKGLRLEGDLRREFGESLWIQRTTVDSTLSP